MPGKDKPHREQKKPKKGAKKESLVSIITPQSEVEVVRKTKKLKGEEF